MPDEPSRPDTASDPGDEPTNETAPDFFTGLWRRTRDRRTVQLTLAYLGLGYFLIVFTSKAFGDNPLIPGIVSTAWVVYWLGLPVVVFAIPLFLTGTHRYRSGLIGGVIVTSLLAGMYLRGMLGRPPDVGGEPDTLGVAAETEGSGSALGDVNGTAGTEPSTTTVQPPSASTEPAPTAAGPAAADPGPTAAARSTTPTEITPFDRLVLLYGESDRISLDTAPQPRALFEGFENPISLRLYGVSGGRLRLRIQGDPRQDAVTLELESTGSEARTQVRIPTACGALTYAVEAVRTASETAEVTATLDTDRSRQEVDRAVALENCRFPPE